LDDRGSLYSAAEEVGKSAGPLLLSFTGVGAILKGKAAVDILKTIVKTGKRPKTDVDAPRPPLRTQRVDVDNVKKGTPEYELLNNPPPNTRIELSNGNVYVTNADGLVDEVSFQPRLIKQPRDGRQTAAGKEGLDTDVGGHIQACSLGGTCDRVNLFPQDANFNNSAYKTFENEIRRALDEGKDVGPITVKFVRKDPKNPRPDEVEVTYTIDGNPETIPFKNEHGGGL